MATDHNFRIKNGLEVGGQLIVNSSGQLQVADIVSNQKFHDNVKLRFGNSSDLQIYHDGSNSYINDVGTGSLYVKATNLVLGAADGEQYVVAYAGGSVNLYHDNAEKLATTSTGIDVTGRIDLDDSNTQLSSGSGNSLRIQTNSGYTEVGPQNTSWSHFETDRARYYFNKGLTVDSGLIGSYDEDLQIQRAGTTKLTVTTAGVDIVGDLSITGDLNTVNTTTLDVSDKVITAGVGGTAATNDGGGFKISGANVEFIWDNTNTQMTLNKDLKFTASEKLRFGNTYFTKSGDSNNVHFYATGGLIPHHTTASNNATLGASSYRWNGVYSNTGNFSGNVTVGGDIYAADSNSSTNPSITFIGHTNTGLSVYQSNSVDRLSIITGGAQRVNFGTHGVESFANVYTGNTSSFRNYGGTWTATTGVTGNGFSFINSVDGTALTLSSTGNAVFAGTITVGQIYTTNNGNGTNIKIGDDAWFGDTNVANTIQITGSQTAANGYLVFGSSNDTALGRAGTGALTYGGSTVWHAGNDGSGSGLDADLLDGQHGSYYAPASSIPTVNNGTLYITTSGSVSGGGSFTANNAGNVTLNLTGNGIMQGTNAVANGAFSNAIGAGFRFQRVTGGSNRAYGSHHNLLQIPNTSGDQYLAQMAFGTGDTKLAWRSKGTSFGSWFDIWHSGNDGSGSGIDADMVDGLHASQFVRSDANDTKSGNLVLQTAGAATDTTTGLHFEVGGSYTDGRWRTRFRKQDKGGGIPLYIDTSSATANVYTETVRIGTYSGNTYEFEVYGDMRATGDIAVVGGLTAATKSFDIKHPTKDGMRLHHGVLEGPEHAVYIRGKTKDSTIQLPEYWIGLVHEDTITVQLTSIGKSDYLYVDSIVDNVVNISNDTEYFYFIQAERKDIERFEVEYGDSL